jgi:hypothetical protein
MQQPFSSGNSAKQQRAWLGVSIYWSIAWIHAIDEPVETFVLLHSAVVTPWQQQDSSCKHWQHKRGSS